MAAHSSAPAWRIPGTGAWWAAVRGAAQSRTRLSDFTFTFHFPALEKAMAAHSSAPAWRIPGTGAWRAAAHGAAQSRTRLKRQQQQQPTQVKGRGLGLGHSYTHFYTCLNLT